MGIQKKSNYSENYYDAVDSLWQELRESPFGKSIGSVPQEDTLMDVGPAGWVEVLDQTTGDVLVEINQNGMVWVHNPKHEAGGDDEIDVTGLSGLLADPQTPLAHAASHAENAADELLVEALGTAGVDTTQFFRPDGTGGVTLGTPSGVVPAAHAASHEDTGSDEIDVTGLSGLLADAQTPLGHAVSHANAGSDELDVTGLSGLLADAQTALAHAVSHEITGSDEIEVDLLTTTEVDTSLRLAPDGAGGLVWAITSAGVTDHGALTGLADDDHPQYATNTEFDDHSARHEIGGADALETESLATAETDTSLRLRPDGLGGVEWATGGGGGITGIDVDEAGGVAATDVQTIDFQSGFDISESPAGTAVVALDLLEVSDFTDHSARHEDAGADEISIAGLAGEAAAAQKVKDHTHGATGTGADGGGSTLEAALLNMPDTGEIEIRDIEIDSGAVGQLNIATNLGGAVPTLLVVGTGQSGDGIQSGLASGVYSTLGRTGIDFGNGGAADVSLDRTAADELTLASGDTLIADKFDFSTGRVWKMSKSANQDITVNSTLTTITFDTVLIDDGHSVIDLANERFVIPFTGIYKADFFWATAGANDPVAGDRTEIQLNGSAILNATMHDTSASGSTYFYSIVFAASAGDTVRLQGFTISQPTRWRGSASPNLSTDFTLTRLS